MWSVIKTEKNQFDILKFELKKKLDHRLNFYCPKIKLGKRKNNKVFQKELNLLGDYILCYHPSFANQNTINSLKFTKGLKYFLHGYIQSQSDIKEFILKCKKSEDQNGYLSRYFFEINYESTYKFASGPFVNKIFKIINYQKNRIDIMLGNVKTSITKSEFSFLPV